MLTLKKNVDSPHATRQKTLEYWFQSALGRSLLANQRQVLSGILHHYFGVVQVEIGVSHRIPVGNPSNIGNKYCVIPEWSSDLPANTLVSSSDELAFESDSVDLVILHHTLDFAKDPHQTLREATRILKSTGYLVLIGFNPVSSWGLRKVLKRKKTAPWNNRFISGNRVADWLTLLHFEVGELAYHYYGLPFDRVAIMRQFMWLNNILNTKVPLGAYYILTAQKQTFSWIQRKKRWRAPSQAVGLRLTSSRNVKNFRSKPQSSE
jgi:SAM-dependent methyltransferase